MSLGTSATAATPLSRRDGELLIVDSLKITIKPTLNPELSDYLKDLTGSEFCQRISEKCNRNANFPESSIND